MEVWAQAHELLAGDLELIMVRGVHIESVEPERRHEHVSRRVEDERLARVRRRRKVEEVLPGLRPARQDDVSRLGVVPDIDFRAFKAIFRGQADGLASAVAKEFGGTVHWYIP